MGVSEEGVALQATVNASQYPKYSYVIAGRSLIVSIQIWVASIHQLGPM